MTVRLVVYYAVDTRYGIQRLTILDWDVVQIDGALLDVDAVGI
ncbi:hypothetical protein [Enterobacter roggenkampii]|nr:hypothetical protein [Enterobacter roggenkampii]